MAAQRPAGMECTYEELRRSRCIDDVEESLFQEQGGICAYTGHRLQYEKGNPTFHVEHIVPQTHCNYGGDADCQNMLACWPRPNCGFEPSYGAKRKDNWPSPAQQNMFVSPLSSSCTSRFVFNWKGEMKPALSTDIEANATITQLGLNHDDIKEIRHKEIQGFLHPASKRITLAQARKLLNQIKRDSVDLDRGLNVQLKPFCFVIEQALEREIRKLKAIMRSR